MAVPYFTDQTLNYIGYLIISSVQLGATVDYAILFANRYFENRTSMVKSEAAFRTIQGRRAASSPRRGLRLPAGLVPWGFVSTNRVISQLGILIARGAVLSAILVLVFLPTLLTTMEGLIRKTTKNRNSIPRTKNWKGLEPLQETPQTDLPIHCPPF